MSEDTIVVASALVLGITKLMTILIARAFCAKPIPQGIRLVQELLIAVFALRVAVVIAFDLSGDALRVPIWLGLAGIGVIVLAANAWRVFGRGDRCPA